MESQLNSSKLENVSMIESSEIFHLPDVPEISEVLEPTGLSPLTSSLDQTLTLQAENMTIEELWTEASSPVSDRAIPLPPAPELNDFRDVDFRDSNTDTNVDSGALVQYGPFFPPSGTPALNNIFAETGDVQDDSTMGPLPGHTEIVVLSVGVCGLRNLGNTCFMAAGLQCLTATPPVLHHFLNLEEKGEKLPPPGSLMAHFSGLLCKMWSGKYSALKPTEFKQTLGVYHSQFKDYRQHDCQEFLALLLDSLHEQMNTAKSSKNCHVPVSTSTAKSSFNLIENSNGKNVSSATATRNSNCASDFLEAYNCLPTLDSPNSPNLTMAGSLRDFNSPVCELDSTANSPRCSPLNDDDDEETLDSEEMMGTKAGSFIHNEVNEGSSDACSLMFNSWDKLYKNVPQLHGLYDIHKEAKTSNANFLVTQQECNNEIHYDSQKFPKENVRRMPLDNSNLMENHDFDNKSVSIKRIKEVNIQKSNCEVDCVSSCSDLEYDRDLEKCNVKRMRLEDQEKNHKCDGLSGTIQCLRTLQPGENGSVIPQDELEADKHWAKHLRCNNSIIVDTFQGQFKSTVICAVCKHVSVTYEPFMYLSVPLPRAMERQFTITYVPAYGARPIRCVVSLNKQSRIGKLKEELLHTLEKETISLSNIALAEILENHISKILDDNTLLRHVNDTNRSIYAFELTDPPDACTILSDSGGERLTEAESCQRGTVANEAIQCTICLDDTGVGLKKHEANNCNFIICDTCIESYPPNQVDQKTCPVCRTHITDFTKVDHTSRPRPVVRILNVPLVLRHDTTYEASNNLKSTNLFGHPYLVRLPSRVNAKDLYDVVKKNIPQEGHYTVHFVDGQGHHCSRCMYNKPCKGCSVPESGIITLQNGDNLAVCYTEHVPKTASPIDHTSITKQHDPLSLYECLQAFSQSETLDEHNPWFCPKCERNQCATKTLTVHRYPKFLIVYLKRFVFYECTSLKLDDKVTFPLVDLNIGRHLYDLYACVCHFGGSSQSTEHNIPQNAYAKAQEKSSERNSKNTECKTQIYPNLHKPTVTRNNVELTNKNVNSIKNISDATHYPQAFKYSFNKEESVNHIQKKEFNVGYARYQQNSCEFTSSSKEKPVKQLNLNQEKVYNNAHIKETPSAPIRDDLLLESMYKPPPDIKNLKEFINSWNIWKEEMRSFLILVDYNKKDYYKWGTFVLNRMGSISHEILQYLIFDKEDDKNNFSVLIEKFDAYHKFVTNAKSENESVINYVERLKVDCIKNIKNVDNMIKQKLEKEIKNLCKERFIAIASSKIPDFKFEKTFKSLTIAEIAFLWDLCNNSIWEENKICKYCGKLHPKDKCFAFGKECNKCKRRNHFSKYCPGVMYINNCSFCGGDHGVKKCLAYNEKCSKCNKLNHFSWMCSKITMLRKNCKFCGLTHVMDRSKCPALKSLCSICGSTGHYDIKCPNSNV